MEGWMDGWMRHYSQTNAHGHHQQQHTRKTRQIQPTLYVKHTHTQHFPPFLVCRMFYHTYTLRQ